ncbi:Subtilisin-like protease SBT5.3 [Linum perenne]
MRSSTSILLLLLSFLLSFQIIQVLAARKSYVVYLGRNAHGSKRTALDGVAMSDTYHKLLASSMKSKDEAKEAIFYSYSSHINAFAATLEDEQVGQLSSHPEVVSVIPNEEYELQTTRSWEFMGLEGRGGNIPDDSIWKKARLGEDVIIANLDTGVWPESTSFDCSETLDAVPTRWKGECEATDDFKCNRKLIGARSFNKGNRAARGQDMDATTSVRDTVGHGTHTLSTAGGCFVPGANLLGSANGTAKGGSPKARLATYKVCWPGCYSADILAAFDAAIQDGVDILSLSLGSSSPRSYDSDTIAIGSFHAVRNGITVVCSAGNSGPYPSSVTNVSPWILTVAASTVDRRFLSNVTLGNGQRFTGFSFNANSLPAGQLYPLITGVAAKSSDAEDSDAKYCFPEALDASKVKGRIVLCRSGGSDIEKSQGIFKAGGVGMILGNSFSNSISPQPHFVPASMVSKEDSDSITSYISTASLTETHLQPDITAPGVYILAAYTEATGDSDSRRLPFNIISGTSMSCPHITGIAGLLKTIHPDWSPAAIKSAIMTTGNTGDEIMSATGSKANPFNYGAGHVRPNKAMDPGLVYDSNLTDYLNFLCYIGYNDEQMSVFYDKSYKCPANSSTASLLNINHPSITVPELSEDVTVTRTLKNVGTSGTYTVSVRAPTGISVRVEPTSLVFRKMNEEKSFEVRLKEDQEVNAGGEYVFGQLIWSDGFHNVTSHIIVRSHTNQIELM